MMNAVKSLCATNLSSQAMDAYATTPDTTVPRPVASQPAPPGAEQQTLELLRQHLKEARAEAARWREESESTRRELDAALRKALIPVYPELEDMRLVDFKVRILDSAGGSAATTRVMIESSDGKSRWSTIGVSPNIVDASYNALYDAITYKLFRDGAKPAQAA